MKLTIAICDDNKIALDSEAKVISDSLSKQKITYSIDKFNNAEALLNSSISYDIVFMDIEMDRLNGIAAAKKIRELNKECLIFFVTNYEGYLDEAFNQHAFRFWVKPIDENKLLYGIESAISELKALKQTVTVSIGNKKTQISAKNIIYVYVFRKILHIVSTGGEIFTDDTYKDIYNQLREFDDFCELHRGYLINFNYVKNYTANEVFCDYQDKTYKINISRRKYDDFHLSFINWMGGKQ